MPRTAKDITGQRFGRLSVTGFSGYGQYGRQRISMWSCQCDCGNTCVVRGDLLKAGRRKSCGCIRYSSEALIGKRFGKLTVLEEDRENRTTLKKVICQCDCGTKKSIPIRNLKSGRTLSCGCDRQYAVPKGDFRERQYNEEMERKRQTFQKGDFSEVHTLSDWVYIWLRDVLPNVVKETTIQMYAETMEHHILSALGERKLEDITEQAVQDWVKCLADAPVPGTQHGRMTEGTVRNILSVLSGSMRDAQKYGLIDRNPCLKAAWTLKCKNVGEEKNWLSEDQISILEPLLAAYCDQDGYPVGMGLRLMLYTGITLSEACALRWRQVDFTQEKLVLEDFLTMRRNGPDSSERRSWELEPLTGRRKREVPVPGSLMRQLKELQRQYGSGPEDFVLCRSSETPVQMDRMRAALLRKGNSCGLQNVTPRMLRDTYAMRAVKAGASSDMIAELMGFASSQQVIRRYMPKAVTDKKELVKKMFGE